MQNLKIEEEEIMKLPFLLAANESIFAAKLSNGMKNMKLPSDFLIERRRMLIQMLEFLELERLAYTRFASSFSSSSRRRHNAMHL